MPKSLVKVNGKEILDYQVGGYLKAGIKEENIYIVTGYRSNMIEEYINVNYNKINIIYSEDYLTTNNMYSLYLALLEIKKKNNFDLKNVFINNADCLYDENLIKEFINSIYNNAIAVDVGSYIEESMKVVVNKDTQLTNIAKTIEEKDSYGVSVDLYKFSQSAIINLYKIICNWIEVAFPELFKLSNIYPFDIKNKKWVEVDNNDDLLLADKLFSDFNYNKMQAYICDLDGTLFIGDTPIKPAIFIF